MRPLELFVTLLLLPLVYPLFWADNTPPSKRTLQEIKKGWTQRNFSILFPNEGPETPRLHLEDHGQYYEYLPLTEARQIRLLRATSNGLEGHVLFELVHVSLDEIPFPYLAVSYTWVDNKTASYITNSENRSLNITRSVSHIFTSLLEEGEPLYLWIDALSINQHDVQERNHQVRLMREIYQKALQVVVSLGKPTEESALAMDFVGPLRSAIERLRQQEVEISEETITAETGRSSGDPIWTMLAELFGRSWFTRIWCVQEVAVGRDPVFVLGDRGVKWDTMVDIAISIDKEGLASLLEYDYRHPRRRNPTPAGILRIAEMDEARHVKQRNEPEKLQEVLMGLHHFNATDDRDRVYALLGLATDADDAMLEPNYAAAVKDVYFQTARHLLLRDNSLLILHRAGIGYPRMIDGLPSWVPEWNSVSPPSFGAMYRTAGYQAAGNTTAKVLPTLDPEKLIVTGVLVDEISHLGSVRAPATVAVDDASNEAHKYNAGLLRWFHEVQNLSIKHLRITWAAGPAENLAGDLVFETALHPTTNETLNEALCSALIANATHRLAPATSSSSSPVSSILASCGAWYYHRLHLDSPDSYPYLASPSSSASTTNGMVPATQWRTAEHFNGACTLATMGRRFFITRTGRYMGFASPGTKKGDLVVVLKGGVTPVILRRRDTGWGEGSEKVVLVGEAYVHGLMSGEGMAVKLCSSEVREFELS